MRNNIVKIVFVDIDETILYHHGKRHDFDKRSIRALKKMQKNGVKVVIATARPYDSALCTGVFDLIQPDAVVTCNGTVASVGSKILYSDAFSRNIVDNVLNTCKLLNFVVEVATPFDRYFTGEPNEYVFEYFKVYHETVPEIRTNFENQDVNALLIFSPKEFDKDLYLKLDDSINGFRFTKCGIDVRTHIVGKADGMKAVMDYFGFSKTDAMSIGDSLGDISMFEMTEFPVAMGNAHPQAKEKACFVTKHIARHGVKHALKHFKLL